MRCAMDIQRSVTTPLFPVSCSHSSVDCVVSYQRVIPREKLDVRRLFQIQLDDCQHNAGLPAIVRGEVQSEVVIFCKYPA